MLQFPPFARAGTTATPSSAPPSPQAHASNATPPQPRPHGAASPAAPGNNAPGARGPPSGPHPVACPLSHRSPGHTPPPNGGFCTIRCIATACRRRVAALMLQFPHTPPQPRPRPSPATANPATASDQPVARHHRRKLRAPPTIQTKRNQTNSLRANCHKLMFNALEFTHEPRRWGHRSPLHPRNC